MFLWAHAHKTYLVWFLRRHKLCICTALRGTRGDLAHRVQGRRWRSGRQWLDSDWLERTALQRHQPPLSFVFNIPACESGTPGGGGSSRPCRQTYILKHHDVFALYVNGICRRSLDEAARSSGEGTGSTTPSLHPPGAAPACPLSRQTGRIDSIRVIIVTRHAFHTHLRARCLLISLGTELDAGLNHLARVVNQETHRNTPKHTGKQLLPATRRNFECAHSSARNPPHLIERPSPVSRPCEPPITNISRCPAALVRADSTCPSALIWDVTQQGESRGESRPG